MAGNREEEIQLIAENRKARHDYHLEDRVEAGLVLQGTEIKSIRARHVQLQDGFVRIINGEAWLFGVHIAPYEQGNRFNHEPTRPRKLLLHRQEIRRLYDQVRREGYTLIPTRLYLKNGRAKVELALARGKKKYDKRQAIAERDAQRRAAAARKMR
ncbi:MAG: SsrA-binding protein SmpB [Bacillota bacterium]|nr:SsrA-binding protein SmpB [Bacillota bacterium]